MSTQSNYNYSNGKSRQKSIKVSQYHIDLLAIFKSDDSTEISQAAALNNLVQMLSSKKSPKIQKCILQVWHKQNESFYFSLKAGNETLETFTVDSVGIPSCGQLPPSKAGPQSLVFLPVLNKEGQSELFVFHPNKISAQDIVIEIAKILENRKKSDTFSLSSRIKENGNSKPAVVNYLHPKDYINKHIEDDRVSLNSLSSNFLNNWYGKFDALTLLPSHSISPLASVNEELSMLNQYLKEIRVFMNHLFELVHGAVEMKKRKNQDSVRSKTDVNKSKSLQVINLPHKSKFIETAEKIKTCLNLAAAHEQRIMNPSSAEITNQLFLFLRILGDASVNRYTGTPDLIAGVKNPLINSTTVKFLTSNLNVENNRYWLILGFNYGFIRRNTPNGHYRSQIDEFEIRDVLDLVDDDLKHRTSDFRQYRANSFSETDLLPKYSTRQMPKNSYRASPVPMVSDDLIYRTFPKDFDTGRKSPLFFETESLPPQKPISRPLQHNNHVHTGNTPWDDRQCRFIDAVLLRNGKLGKATSDRSAQNYRELGVTFNEVVEILRDHGDSLHIKNALGETGYCPKALIEEIYDKHSRS